MKDLVEDFLKEKSFAVVGSFRDESKYAYKILKTLAKKGCAVYPVNPNISDVEGIRCYKRINDIPFDIDAVSIVTPPSVTDTIVKECLRNGIKKIWLQPGAESETAITFCRDNGMDVIHGLCVMLESL